jgi:hypothetical protein
LSYPATIFTYLIFLASSPGIFLVLKTIYYKRDCIKGVFFCMPKLSMRYRPLLILALLLLTFVLSACSGFGDTSGTPGAKKSSPTADAVKPASVKWCTKPAMLFRDQSASNVPTAVNQGAATPINSTLPPANGTPTTLKDWATFKANAGFTIFLPPTLPPGACLVSASGTLRDPVFGANFTIGYLLPGGDSISLSEAPVRTQNNTFQCTPDTAQSNGTSKDATPTPTPTGQAPLQLCTGARGTTNIVFSARGTATDLQKFFELLQADVEWVPVS